MKITKDLIDMEPNNPKFKDNIVFYKRALADQILQKIELLDEKNFEKLTVKDLILLNEKNETSGSNKTVEDEKPKTLANTEREKYERLCREEVPNVHNYNYNLICCFCFNNWRKSNFLKEKMRARLKCRYVNDHPLLVIGPVKQEKVFEDPDIFVYHDVLSEKQAERMITMARPRVGFFYSTQILLSHT